MKLGVIRLDITFDCGTKEIGPYRMTPLPLDPHFDRGSVLYCLLSGVKSGTG